MADFERGESFVSNLPTVFLLAGIHGNEVTGTNVLYHLLSIFKEEYFRNAELADLLLNVRLLIMPTSNVSGFDRVTREEVWPDHHIDPNRDFPFNIAPG